MLIVLVRRELLVDDVIGLIAMRGKIMIREIQDIFNLDLKTTRIILDFLVRYDFAKLEGQSLSLSETCAPFFGRSERRLQSI
jgi:hypothetical protein